jgi:rod shape-determining protein MreC
MQVAVERRPTLLLIVVLAVLFVLMSISDETRAVGETRTMFERAVMTLFSPIPRSVNWIGQTASDIYHGYIDMRGQVVRNRELRQKVDELTKENLALRSAHDDLARMRQLLGYHATTELPTMLADVVMLDTAGRFKSMILDQGRNSGIAINDTVVSPSGLLGRVVLTTPELSKVQLIIDPKAVVGARIERTRRTGIIRGDGRGALLLENIPALADVVPGDRIVTAGIDGIYPSGIPVAVVVEVEEGSDLYKRVVCAPTASFSSLEDALILHTEKLPPEVVRYAP